MSPQESGEVFPGPMLTGAAILIVQFDVADEIRLEALAKKLGLSVSIPPGSSQSTPVYGRYERPPVVEPIRERIRPNQLLLAGELKYYDYGVISVLLRTPFSCGWEQLIKEAADGTATKLLTQQAERIVRQKILLAAQYMVHPYTHFLNEEYAILHLSSVEEISSSDQLLDRYESQIARLVRSDAGPLSKNEISEVVRSHISYYTTDLAVLGWSTALLYDTSAGASEAIQLLEYANSQLLEFRYYDELLTRELAKVYSIVDRPSRLLSRWRLARSATRLHATLLEIDELTERVDNSVKFLGDMFAARFYHIAAVKIGVPDYRGIVHAKVQRAENLYQFMAEQFSQSRAFVLELIVVVILLIELVLVLRGVRT